MVWIMDKRKIIDILITAGLSALIAFFQNLLISHTAPALPSVNPVEAGSIGMIIRGATILRYV